LERPTIAPGEEKADPSGTDEGGVWVVAAPGIGNGERLVEGKGGEASGGGGGEGQREASSFGSLHRNNQPTYYQYQCDYSVHNHCLPITPSFLSHTLPYATKADTKCMCNEHAHKQHNGAKYCEK
jgi:hypothetical protein